jgi:hypothetical protein
MASRSKTLERPPSERRHSNNRHGTIFRPDFRVSVEQLTGDEDTTVVGRDARSSSYTARSRRPTRLSALDEIAPKPRNKSIDEIVAQLSPTLVDTRLMMPYFIANNSTTVVSEMGPGTPTGSEGVLYDADSVAPTDSTLSINRTFAMKDRRLLKKQARATSKKRQPEDIERLAKAVCYHALFCLSIPHNAVTRDKKLSL